jgi:hypothetical protein
MRTSRRSKQRFARVDYREPPDFEEEKREWIGLDVAIPIICDESAEFTAVADDGAFCFVYMVRLFLDERTGGRHFFKLGSTIAYGKNSLFCRRCSHAPRRARPFSERIRELNGEYNCGAQFVTTNIVIVAVLAIDAARAREQFFHDELAEFRAPLGNKNGTGRWTELYEPTKEMYEAFVSLATRAKKAHGGKFWKSRAYDIDTDTFHGHPLPRNDSADISATDTGAAHTSRRADRIRRKKMIRGRYRPAVARRVARPAAKTRQYLISGLVAAFCW